MEGRRRGPVSRGHMLLSLPVLCHLVMTMSGVKGGHREATDRHVQQSPTIQRSSDLLPSFSVLRSSLEIQPPIIPSIDVTSSDFPVTKTTSDRPSFSSDFSSKSIPTSVSDLSTNKNRAGHHTISYQYEAEPKYGDVWSLLQSFLHTSTTVWGVNVTSVYTLPQHVITGTPDMTESTSSESLDFPFSSTAVRIQPNIEGVTSATILPTPVLSMSVDAPRVDDVINAQLSDVDDVINVLPSEWTWILRLKMEMDRGLNVKSPQFVQRMEEAVAGLYRAALDKQYRSKGHRWHWRWTVLDQRQRSKGRRRYRRQVQQQMTDVIVDGSRTSMSVNSTLTVGDPTAADMIIITTGLLILATRSSSSSSSSTSSSTTSMFLPSSVVGPSLTLSPTMSSSTMPTVSSSSPVSSTVPSSSEVPPVDTLRKALLSIDLDLKHMKKEGDSEFQRNFEKGIVLAYLQALQMRRKRHVPESEVIHVRRHDRFIRQAGPDVEAQVVQVQMNTDDPELTNVTFYLMEDGQAIPALTAASVLNKLTPTVLSALLAYPVMSVVQPVDRPFLPPPPLDGDADDSRLFVVVIVLPSVLLLLLVIALMAALLYSCRHPLSASSGTAPPVTATKYKPGDSLSDFSQHMDLEGVETLELSTFRPIRLPAALRLPPRSHHSMDRSKTSSADSNGCPAAQRPKADRHSGEGSVDSADSAYRESRKKTYQAGPPRMVRSDGERRHVKEGGEESVVFGQNGHHVEEEVVQRSAIYHAQRKPPKARPRSLLRKLHSKHGHTSSLYQEQPADVTASEDFVYTSTRERRRTRDENKRRDIKSREAKAHAQHTDASGDFTTAVPESGSAHSSREHGLPSSSADAQFSERERPRNRTAKQPIKERSQRQTRLKNDTDIADKSSSKPHSHPQTSPHKRSSGSLRSTSEDSDGHTEHGQGQRGDSSPQNDVTMPLSTTQTHKPQSSHSDVTDGGERRTKSVAVGPDNINKKTQTPASRDSRRQQVRRKPRNLDSFSHKPPSAANANDKQKERELLLENLRQRQQQQDMLTLVHQHLASQPPSHLPSGKPRATLTTTPPAPSSSSSTPISTTAAATPQTNRQILELLLDEACMLAPRGQHPGPRQLGSPDPQPTLMTSHPVVNGGGEETWLSCAEHEGGPSSPPLIPSLSPPGAPGVGMGIEKEGGWMG